jgi:hypothetical protein
MQLVIRNQFKGPGNDCIALTTKLEEFPMRLIMYYLYAKFHLIWANNNLAML